MPPIFQPHRGEDPAAQIRHIENALTAVTQALNRLNVPVLAAKNTGGAALTTTAAVGGGSSGAGVLAGDVVGPAAANDVAALQGVALTLTSPVTGQVVTYTGTALVNSDTVTGNLTLTGTLTAAGETLSVTDAGTNTEPTLLTVQHRTSGTPGAAFGSTVAFRADNSANALTDQLLLASGWSSPTAGSENSLAIFSVRRAGVNTEVMRFSPAGAGRTQFANDLFHANAAGAVGFYGTTPVPQAGAYTLAGTATRVLPSPPAAPTGVDNTQVGLVYAQVSDLATVTTALNALIGVVRQLAADLGKTSGIGINGT
jgi:hypothetical protein